MDNRASGGTGSAGAAPHGTGPSDSLTGVEPVAGFDSRTFRNALGHFATGITVIGASHPTAGLIGLTANSFNSVSLDPPLILFSIARTSTCITALLETPGFAVSILNADQKTLSQHFSRGGHNKWAGIEHRLARDGSPILPGALAVFECERYATHDGGDHVIVVGRVLALEQAHGGKPLLYYRGHYRALGEEAG